MTIYLIPYFHKKGGWTLTTRTSRAMQISRIKDSQAHKYTANEIKPLLTVSYFKKIIFYQFFSSDCMVRLKSLGNLERPHLNPWQMHGDSRANFTILSNLF